MLPAPAHTEVEIRRGAIGKVDADGTVRKAGRTIGRIESAGIIRKDGSTWGTASNCCGELGGKRAVLALLVFFATDYF